MSKYILADGVSISKYLQDFQFSLENHLTLGLAERMPIFFFFFFFGILLSVISFHLPSPISIHLLLSLTCNLSANSCREPPLEKPNVKKRKILLLLETLTEALREEHERGVKEGLVEQSRAERTDVNGDCPSRPNEEAPLFSECFPALELQDIVTRNSGENSLMK